PAGRQLETPEPHKAHYRSPVHYEATDRLRDLRIGRRCGQELFGFGEGLSEPTSWNHHRATRLSWPERPPPRTDALGLSAPGLEAVSSRGPVAAGVAESDASPVHISRTIRQQQMARISSKPAVAETSIDDGSERPLVLNLFVSLRPGQWTKNLLVFA